MRKWMALILVLPLCLCACERETLTDPVLFCEGFNSRSAEQIAESDAYLRSDQEVMLFAGEAVIRLRMNEDGAIHTAVVSADDSERAAEVCENAFAVLAEPFSESVPPQVITLCRSPALTVQTAGTKRFYYAVFCDGQTFTAVQINRLLSAIPILPTLRLPESE